MKTKWGVMVCAVAVMFVSSCATTPSMSSMEADVQGFELPKSATADTAVVYIVRPSKLGLVVSFKVYVDKKETEYWVGTTKGGQYICFEVQPGTHALLSQAENLAEIKFTAEASKTYFFEQVPQMGVLMARNDLVVVQDTQGTYWVKKLKPGEVK